MDTIELVIIAGVLAVFFFLGPKKIPELAKAFGQAKKSFKEGSE